MTWLRRLQQRIDKYLSPPPPAYESWTPEEMLRQLITEEGHKGTEAATEFRERARLMREVQ